MACASGCRDQSTGCSSCGRGCGGCGGCGGLCEGGCGGGCGGCGSGCSGGCSGSCGSGCSGGCSGSCSGGCRGGCSGGCSGGCRGCSGSCTDSCNNGCTGAANTTDYNAINAGFSDYIRNDEIPHLYNVSYREANRRNKTTTSATFGVGNQATLTGINAIKNNLKAVDSSYNPTVNTLIEKALATNLINKAKTLYN